MKKFLKYQQPETKTKEDSNSRNEIYKIWVTSKKLIDLVQVRNIDNKKLLSYNLVPSLYLFHEEGYMIESGKSVLVREIEVLHQ